MIDRDIDQHLEVVDFYATTTQQGENPPTLMLVLDVIHTETGHQWRQQVTFSRERWVAMMNLLAYVAKTEGVEWTT